MLEIDGTIVHDADAHVFEEPDWFFGYADAATRAKLKPLYVDARGAGLKPGEPSLLEHFRAKHRDPEYRAQDAEQIWLRKNWAATGAFIAEDRPLALDLLGVASQLVFNTFANGTLQRAEVDDDLDLAYGMAAAHNRAMLDFCRVDARLLPTCYVPLADLDRCATAAREWIDAGAAALLIASAPPAHHSPSHVGLDPVWRQAEEAGIPVVFHVGGGGRLIDPVYFDNGLPPVPDFHGGDGNFRSVDYMAIPYPVMTTLGTMIIDGVLDRFPALRVGVIEQGASWVPGWMRSLDSAADAFRRNEERLQRLRAKPSEIVREQVRVTPYPHEDAGWAIEQGGEEVFLFSTDFPHVEGGRNPLGRFARTLANVSPRARRRFYCDNFEDLMGAGLPAALRAPAAPAASSAP
jgi:predicted TIM-barrel fold metal-dependent hydrolase